MSARQFLGSNSPSRVLEIVSRATGDDLTAIPYKSVERCVFQGLVLVCICPSNQKAAKLAQILNEVRNER